MDAYYRFILTLIKWFSVMFLATGAIIGICILLDWFGHFGWGYQWYSLPALALFIVVGLLIHKAAVYALKRTAF